ncbi:hypothetical protein RCO48_01080 [Peribacillus frigoritolerans]|nr:hypothetical protein [Peribacillus frigoritolerans]
MTFIEKHSVIYFKPASGSQGRNICRLTQVAGKWKIEQSGHLQNVHFADTDEKLFETLKKIFQKTILHSSKKGFPYSKPIREKLISAY